MKHYENRIMPDEIYLSVLHSYVNIEAQNVHVGIVYFLFYKNVMGIIRIYRE